MLLSANPLRRWDYKYVEVNTNLLFYVEMTGCSIEIKELVGIWIPFDGTTIQINNCFFYEAATHSNYAPMRNIKFVCRRLIHHDYGNIDEISKLKQIIAKKKKKISIIFFFCLYFNEWSKRKKIYFTELCWCSLRMHRKFSVDPQKKRNKIWHTVI